MSYFKALSRYTIYISIFQNLLKALHKYSDWATKSNMAIFSRKYIIIYTDIIIGMTVGNLMNY